MTTNTTITPPAVTTTTGPPLPVHHRGRIAVAVVGLAVASLVGGYFIREATTHDATTSTPQTASRADPADRALDATLGDVLFGPSAPAGALPGNEDPRWAAIRYSPHAGLALIFSELYPTP